MSWEIDYRSKLAFQTWIEWLRLFMKVDEEEEQDTAGTLGEEETGSTKCEIDTCLGR